MKTYQNILYRLVIIGCMFAAFNIIHSTQLFARKSNNEVQVKTLKVLPRLGYQTALGLYLDTNGSIIAFCSKDDFSGQNENKIFVFSQQQAKWFEKEYNCKGVSSRIISNAKFQLVTYGDLRQPESSLEVYDLTDDLMFTEQPRLSLDLYSEQKFKKEYSRRIISVAAGDSPDSFLVLGEYSADNLNLFTLWHRIASAGHAGIVNIPFAAQITDGRATGFYNLQTKYEDNEYVSDISGITEGRVVHVTWIKGENYCADTPKIMYAQFDLDTHTWSQVFEVFRGVKRDSKSIRYFEAPSALILDSNLHCAWTYANMEKKTETPLDNSGVFYRCKEANGWDSICKVSDSAASQCKLAIGQSQDVHLFWVDYKKGVYHTYKDVNGWQDATLIYEDSALDWTLPFDVKIDQTGDFHLIYIRRTSHASPSELMYVKIEK